MRRMSYSRSHKAAAWGVHIYTALGLPLAFMATFFLFAEDARMFFVTMCIAVFVDATDGTMARRIGVAQVTPDFDGRRLDDIVDFLTFAFLPSLALAALKMFPEGYEVMAIAPLLASGYGFCQERAKTEDSFVGFPSYWNIGVLYLFLLDFGPWVNLATILFFSALVFVPFHYVYPTKTKRLKKVTVGGGALWAAVMTWLAFNAGEPWTRDVALLSSIYPLYYFALSAVHHMEHRTRTTD